MNQIVRILRMVSKYWSHVLQDNLVGIVMTLLALLIPYFTMLLIDEVFPNKDWSLLYLILLGSFVLSIFSVVVDVMRGYFQFSVRANMGLDLRYGFYNHLLSQDVDYYNRSEVGETLTRFGDLDDSISGSVELVNKVFINLLSFLIFPAVLFYINWKLALISIAALPFDVLIFIYSSRYIARTEKTMTVQGADLAAKNYETLSGIRVILALGIEKLCFGKYKRAVLEIRHLERNHHLLTSISGSLTTLAKATSTIVYTWFGWTQILNGNMALGSFMAFSMYVDYLYRPIRETVGLIQEIPILKVHTERFFEIHDMRPAITSPGDAITPILNGEVQFRNVWFGYTPDHLVLQDVDFVIEKGQTLALVGRSGAGKSTLVNLIPRFYDPADGLVTIDGHDVKRLDLYALRQQVGFVHQESFLFFGTILENIAIGRRDVNQQQIEDAARQACAHEFINEFPQGYDTQVGERGIQLSQGQKQRIALARVLLLDSPVLILDEASSALDVETEARIQSVLREVRREKTTIILSHRLSAIKDADRILVIDDGRIVEQGSHHELLDSGPVYKKLYSNITMSNDS